jgi:multidrug efflux system membrane fusion protein
MTIASGGRRGSLALVLWWAVAGAGCGSAKAKSAQPPAVPVVVAQAARRDVPVELLAIGTVEAYSTISVKPQVGGVITEVHFSEGADVRSGDPLFTIDPRPYEAAVAQAEGQLARDEAQARNAAIELKRGESLLAEGVLAPEQHDQLRSNADALQAAVRGDQAALQKARLDLSYTRIESPIDGRAGGLLVNRGNLVKAIDGGPLVTINKIDPIYLSFPVPEKRLPEIRAARASGQVAVVAVVPGDEAHPVPGRLSFLDNQVDRGSGTIRLKATFDNRERRLWPGQFANARLTLAVRKGAVVVPAEAVQEGQAGSYVFVVKPDNSVESRGVEVDGAADGLAVVLKGVEAGETVVTDGQLRLTPGARVEPRAPAPQKAGS